MLEYNENLEYMIWNYGNHHVMTYTGNRVNATFIPDNFDHILIAVYITI